MAATSAVLIGKRVNFVLSEKAHSELVGLAKETRRTMTELVRLGLGLARVAIEAQRNGNRLVVTNAAGDAIKEIILPG
jgi:hypothetical protein